MLDIRINKFLFFLFGHRSISKYSLFTVDYGGFFSILYSVFVFVFVHVITFQINICWMFWIFCSFFLYSSHSQTDISHTNSVLCFFLSRKNKTIFYSTLFLFSFSLLILRGMSLSIRQNRFFIRVFLRFRTISHYFTKSNFSMLLENVHWCDDLL